MAELGDIAVNEAADLILSNGDMLIRHRSESVKQRVRIALLHFLGEWFRDPSQGVPWTQQILVRKFQNVIADREIRRAILSVPGVVSVTKIDFHRDNSTRLFKITAQYRDRYSTTIQTIEVDSP